MAISGNEKITTLDSASMSKKEYHLQSWKASGQKISEYCKENGLAQSTLRHWAKNISEPKSKFKQISTPPIPRNLDKPPKLLVKLGGSMKLYFHNIDDVNSITKLLKELN